MSHCLLLSGVHISRELESGAESGIEHRHSRGVGIQRSVLAASSQNVHALHEIFQGPSSNATQDYSVTMGRSPNTWEIKHVRVAPHTALDGSSPFISSLPFIKCLRVERTLAFKRCWRYGFEDHMLQKTIRSTFLKKFFLHDRFFFVCFLNYAC